MKQTILTIDKNFTGENIPCMSGGHVYNDGKSVRIVNAAFDNVKIFTDGVDVTVKDCVFMNCTPYCEHCNGSGIGWDMRTYTEIPKGCTRCNGTGKIPILNLTKKSPMFKSTPINEEREKIIAAALETEAGKIALAGAMLESMSDYYRQTLSNDELMVYLRRAGKTELNKYRLLMAKEIFRADFSQEMEKIFLNTDSVRTFSTPRRSGMSTMILLDAITYAQCFSNSRILIVTSSISERDRLIRQFCQYLPKTKKDAPYLVEFAIDTLDGQTSFIRFTATPGQTIIGKGRLDRILVDNYSHFRSSRSAEQQLGPLTEMAINQKINIGLFDTYNVPQRQADDEDIRMVQSLFSSCNCCDQSIKTDDLMNQALFVDPMAIANKLHNDKLKEAQWLVAESHPVPIKIVKIPKDMRPATDADIQEVQDEFARMARDPNEIIICAEGIEIDYVGSSGKVTLDNIEDRIALAQSIIEPIKTSLVTQYVKHDKPEIDYVRASGKVMTLDNSYAEIDEKIIDSMMLDKTIIKESSSLDDLDAKTAAAYASIGKKLLEIEELPEGSLPYPNYTKCQCQCNYCKDRVYYKYEIPKRGATPTTMVEEEELVPVVELALDPEKEKAYMKEVNAKRHKSWDKYFRKCEHCNGSGVGLDWMTLKDIPNGCTRCNGKGEIWHG